MSGGTGASYRVESAAEVRLRRQRAALAEYAAVAAELVALRAEADAYRSVYGRAVGKMPAPPRLPADPEAEAVAAATAALAGTVRQQRQRLDAAIAAAAERAVRTMLPDRGPAPPALPDAGRPEPDDGAAVPAGSENTTRWEHPVEGGIAPGTESPAQREAMVERATGLLARLPADTAPDVRRICEQAAVAVGDASTSRARLLLSDLAERVGAEIRRAGAVRRAGIDLARLAAALATLSPGGEAERLRRRVAQLAQARVDRVPEDLAAGVAAAVARADRDREREAVADALRLSLGELGYEVTVGFETALAAEGVAFAALPHATGYGVKLLLDGDRPVLRTQVVRASGAGGDPAQDAAAEQGFCDDYPILLARLARHGIGTAELGRYPPGTVPVQAVSDRLLPEVATGTGRHVPRELRA
jgi:hypothetical protein